MLGVLSTVWFGGGLASAQSTERQPVLVDHSPDAAIFRVGSELAVRRAGESIPFSTGRVAAIVDSGVLIEYHATAKHTGGLRLLMRGQLLQQDWDIEPGLMMAIPSASVAIGGSIAESPATTGDRAEGDAPRNESPP